MAQITISQPEDLREVIEAENNELAQQGYLARFRVGVPISRTEAAIALNGQIRACHPKFK